MTKDKKRIQNILSIQVFFERQFTAKKEHLRLKCRIVVFAFKATMNLFMLEIEQNKSSFQNGQGQGFV